MFMNSLLINGWYFHWHDCSTVIQGTPWGGQRRCPDANDQMVIADIYHVITLTRIKPDFEWEVYKSMRKRFKNLLQEMTAKVALEAWPRPVFFWQNEHVLQNPSLRVQSLTVPGFPLRTHSSAGTRSNGWLGWTYESKGSKGSGWWRAGVVCYMKEAFPLHSYSATLVN